MEAVTLVLSEEEFHFLKVFIEFGLKKLGEDPTKPYIIRIQQRLLEDYMRRRISSRLYEEKELNSRNEVKLAPF